MKLLVSANVFTGDRKYEIKTIEEIDKIIVGKKLSEMELINGQDITIMFAWEGMEFEKTCTVIDTESLKFREGLVMKIKDNNK